MSEDAHRVADLSPQEKRRLLAALLRERAAAAAPEPAAAALVPAPADRYEPFPLTAIQQAYWVGRGSVFELGNIGAHVYHEFDTPRLDPERLSHAWQRLIDRHDMLRVVFLPDGRQQVLQHVPSYRIEVDDLSGGDPASVAAQLDALRERLSHRMFAVDRWPLFEIRLVRLPGNLTRICLGCDLLVADLRSFQIMLNEWFALYENPRTSLAPLAITFRDYVLAERASHNTPGYARAEDYWRRRVPMLPPAPALPLCATPASLSRPRFTRRTATLPKERWSRLKERASQAGITPAAMLLTVFAEILETWSAEPRFTINVTIFNRMPLHPQVGNLVGEFTSVNLLEVDTTAPEPFQERARRVQEQLWTDLDHRQYHGVNVLRELATRMHGGVSRAVMPVVFTCDLAHDLRSAQDAHSWILPGEVVYGISQTPQLYLDHQALEQVGALVINWDAIEALFPDGLLQEMFDAEMRHLERLCDDEKAWEGVTPCLVPAAQLQQRAAINATGAAVPDRLAHELFSDQVAERPEQPAVIAADRTLTYAALSKEADRVARRLRERGARPGTLVAVVMEKGWEQVVAVLGISRSGAAYLPIDPSVPPERLAWIFGNSRAELAVTQPRLGAHLSWPAGVERLTVDRDDPPASAPEGPPGKQRPDDLAYVIYTSGSTGVPKGVMIEHHSVVNRMLDVNRRFGISPGDRVLALTALHHDLSVFDIFGVLAAGGTIVMPDADGAKDPATWARLLAQEKVTVWNSVPAFMEILVEHLERGRADSGAAPPDLRLALLSGDWIPVSLPDRLRALIPGVEVISLGGPTEVTVWDICHRIRSVDPAWKSIPYGTPMANARYDVLDHDLEPRPVWVPGELWTGGAGLARGYWADPERTRERFVVHPRTGERLYRSGDLGRYLPDGTIEILGRLDLQVKIRGQRIEPGEIEAALRQHALVRDAVVTTGGKDTSSRHLAAYLVSGARPAPSTDDLRAFLRTKLPEHMVPAAFVFLDALPLTANGKVDRRALPEAGAQPAAPRPAPRAPATDLERRVSELVAGVLNTDRVDPRADLFALGMTSADMMRIAALLEETFGARPEMADLFRLTTVASLAELYEQRRAGAEPPSEPAAVAPSASVESILGSFSVLLDNPERERFRDRQPGLRPFDPATPAVGLPSPAPADEALARMYRERRSHRRFSAQPVSLEQLGGLLGSLRQVTLDGRVKYRYGSSGTLYPIQVYAHVKPDRVQGVGPGIYYYHPVDHRLVLISAPALFDSKIHWPHNRRIFDAAAFGVFLIAQLSALGPIYGEQAARFPFIEAGLITQLLETVAPTCGVGLCQIGGLNFERVRDLFALDETHLFAHSLLGGVAEEPPGTAGPR